MSKLILKDENGQQYPIASQDEFDNKVNVDKPLTETYSGVLKSIKDLGVTAHEQNILQAFHDSDTSNMTIGDYGSGIIFGVSNTVGVLNVHWGKHQARIIGSISNSDNYWSEDIAWKSDIQKLEQEISDLKKQIGGGKTTS